MLLTQDDRLASIFATTSNDNMLFKAKRHYFTPNEVQNLANNQYSEDMKGFYKSHMSSSHKIRFQNPTRSNRIQIAQQMLLHKSHTRDWTDMYPYRGTVWNPFYPQMLLLQ